jgi:hypothetical protein
VYHERHPPRRTPNEVLTEPERIPKLEAERDAANKAAEWQAKDAAKARERIAELERPRTMTDAERAWCDRATSEMAFALQREARDDDATACRNVLAERHPPKPQRTAAEVLAEFRAHIQREHRDCPRSEGYVDELAALLEGKGTD